MSLLTAAIPIPSNGPKLCDLFKMLSDRFRWESQSMLQLEERTESQLFSCVLRQNTHWAGCHHSCNEFFRGTQHKDNDCVATENFLHCQREHMKETRCNNQNMDSAFNLKQQICLYACAAGIHQGE